MDHRTIRSILWALVLALGVVILIGVAVENTRADSLPPRAATLPRPAEVGRTRARLLRKVERGLELAERRWWRNGWFDDPDSGGRARIWETVHVVEAATGLAAATNAARHRATATRYAAGAHGYWDADLAGGVGGFATEYGSNGDVNPNWFDDNGWLGLAFLDAYRVTHERRFLDDARRAFRYLDGAGWDRRSGGIWWSSKREFKAGESIVTASLLAVELAEITHYRSYLRAARRLIDWANGHVFDARQGLYTRMPGSRTAISYLQSPMISAMARLCRSARLYCPRVPRLIDATLARYGGPLSHAPQYDAMYLRFLVDAYEVTGEPRLYAAAYRTALAAEEKAESGGGFLEHDWLGGDNEVKPLQAHGATLEALAWVAAAKPPSR